jgi:hypothetical protein
VINWAENFRTQTLSCRSTWAEATQATLFACFISPMEQSEAHCTIREQVTGVKAGRTDVEKLSSENAGATARGLRALHTRDGLVTIVCFAVSDL